MIFPPLPPIDPAHSIPYDAIRKVPGYAQPFVEKYAQDYAVAALASGWGRAELMVVAAFRYCLGRQSYIVSDCVEWLLTILPRLSPGTLRTLRRDLDEEYRRADQGVAYALGADMDRREWDRLRQALMTMEDSRS
jgi:hypothetical protein